MNLPTPSKKLKHNDCKFGFEFCGLEHCREKEKPAHRLINILIEEMQDDVHMNGNFDAEEYKAKFVSFLEGFIKD